jgi:hypothetical protein
VLPLVVLTDMSHGQRRVAAKGGHDWPIHTS